MFAGKDVVILQNLLLRSPFVKPIETTGIYDNNTAHAVASYQNGNHLPRYNNNPVGGGGYSINPWVGRCGSAPHTLTPFKTKIADFRTQDRIPIFDTLFKTFKPKPYPV